MAITKKMAPLRGRSLHVEKIEASADWLSFLSDAVNVQISGHTQTRQKTKAHQEAVHVFRISRRGDLPEAQQAAVTSTFKDRPSADDIILSTKLYQASPELSQAPQVLCPVQAGLPLGNLRLDCLPVLPPGQCTHRLCVQLPARSCTSSAGATPLSV